MGRDLTDKSQKSKTAVFLRWEMILIYILVLINVILMVIKPNLYFASGTVTSMIQSGLEASPLVLGMALVTMLGDVDVSCAATMIFAGMITGISMDHGIPAALAVILGLMTGVLLGAFNGYLVAYIGLPAVITTIATSIFYRGIVKIILDVNVLKNYPAFYSKMAWRSIGGIPISMIVFLILAIAFCVLLHKTPFGRKLYLIGNSAVTAQYSGINVKKIKLMVFMLMGLMSGVASIFFVGRMGGGLNSAMGTGEEMNAIAIVALGGISGGHGKMFGPIIGVFILAALTYSLGLMGVSDNGKNVFTGIILIGSVALMNLKKK